MKRIDENTIQITQEELDMIQNFINNSLDQKWNRYTDHYICEGETWEEGKRRMNPEMYDFAEAASII